MDVTGIRVKLEGAPSAKRDADNLTDSLNRLGRSGTQVEGSFDGMKSTVLSSKAAFLGALGGAVALLAGLKELTEAVIQNELAWQRAEAKVRFATGSIPAAADAMKFVREEADRLGLVNLQAAESFGIIAASAKGTRLEGEATRQIFLGMAEASSALSLSAEDVDGALIAIAQVMSKGKVQAEELRGQLGERIPGAFQIASRAMGVTTMELDKMLEQGKVMSDDFLPKFGAELRKTFGEDAQKNAQGLQQEINRMTNAWQDLLRALGETGIIEAAADVIRRITDFAERAAGAIRLLTDSFKDLKDVEFAETAAGRLEVLQGEINRLTDLSARFAVDSKSYKDIQESLRGLRAEYTATFNKLVDISKRAEETKFEPPKLPPAPPPSSTKAVKDFAKELQSVIHALDPIAAATDKYKEQIKTLDEALKRGRISQEQWAKLTDEAGKNLAKVKAPALAVVDALREELDLLKLDNRERFIREQILRAGPNLLDAEAESIRDWAGALYDAQEAAKVVEVQAGPFTQAWERAVESVEDALARGLVDGFRDTADAIRSIFKSLLVDLVRAAISNPVRIALGVGATSAAGTAAANTIGQGGGTNLFSSIATQGLFGGTASFLGSVLPGALGTGAATTSGILTAGGGVLDVLGAATTGSTGLLSSIGMVLPYLAPLALALPFLSQLFGSKPHPFATTIAGGLPAGTVNASGDRFPRDAVGRNLVTGESGLSLGLDFKHADESEAAKFQQGLQAIDAGLTELFPKVDLAGVSLGRFGVTAEGFVAGIENGTERMVASADQVTAQFVTDWLVAADVLSESMTNLVANMEGTTEELLSVAGAFKVLEGFLDADLHTEYGKLVSAANMTLYESFQAQASAVERLARNYDGTVDATLELANATQLFGQTALAVLQQIDAARASVGQNAEDFLRAIDLSVLDTEGQYGYLKEEADSIAEELARATDPARIAELQQSWFQAATAAFNLLDEDQRKTLAPEFRQDVRDIDTLTNERLDAVESRVGRDFEEQQTLTQQQIDAAGKMVSAADRIEAATAGQQTAGETMLTAANTSFQASDRFLAAANTPLTIVDQYGQPIGRRGAF